MKKEVVFIQSSLILMLLQLFLGTTEGRRILERCELVLEMDKLNLGISRLDLARWAFIADEVSSYQTDVVSPENRDGSRNYGLFQISNKYWCLSSTGQRTKNVCEVDCVELLSDNIKASVDCALKIQQEDGWKPWPALKEFEFSGETSVDKCFEVKTVETTVNGTTTGGGSGSMPKIIISPKIGQAFSSKHREF